MKINIPNLLTLLRLALIPVFVVFFEILHNPLAGAIVFIIAAFTDWLDGFLARRWNQISDFGKVMDPLADKLMLVTALICMARNDMVPWIIVVFVLAKEAMMIIAGIILYHKKVVVYSKLCGKIATVAFTVAVAVSFLQLLIRGSAIKVISNVLFAIAIGFAVLAFAQYVIDFWSKRNQLDKQ